MALDEFQVGWNKTGSGLSRFWFEESVDEPESAWGEDTVQLGQIIGFVFDAVEAAEIKGEVERWRDLTHLRGIVREDAGLYTGFLQFAFGKLNGARDEVEAFCLPACVDKGNEVGAGAAADIKRATGWMGGDKVVEFRRRDAAVPRRIAEQVGDIEFYTTEKITHWRGYRALVEDQTRRLRARFHCPAHQNR